MLNLKGHYLVASSHVLVDFERYGKGLCTHDARRRDVSYSENVGDELFRRIYVLVSFDLGGDGGPIPHDDTGRVGDKSRRGNSKRDRRNLAWNTRPNDRICVVRLCSGGSCFGSSCRFLMRGNLVYRE